MTRNRAERTLTHLYILNPSAVVVGEQTGVETFSERPRPQFLAASSSQPPSPMMFIVTETTVTQSSRSSSETTGRSPAEPSATPAAEPVSLIVRGSSEKSGHCEGGLRAPSELSSERIRCTCR